MWGYPVVLETLEMHISTETYTRVLLTSQRELINGESIPRGSLSLTKPKVLFSTLLFLHVFPPIKRIMHTDCLLSVCMMWNFCCNKWGSEDFSVNALPVYLCGLYQYKSLFQPQHFIPLPPSPKDTLLIWRCWNML